MAGEGAEYRDRNGQRRGWAGRENLPNAHRPAPRSNDVAYAKALFMLPPIDLADPDAVSGRYFEVLGLAEEHGRAMTVEALCMGVGTNRDALLRWGRGERTHFSEELSPESARTLKKCLESLAGMWATHMASGDFKQPVTGIFIGKNNYGYSDESTSVIRHEAAPNGPSKAELEAKYRSALPEETPVVNEEDGSTYELPRPGGARKPRRKTGGQKGGGKGKSG